jgi:DNA-binding NarL/FixJ family response regulator
MDSYLIHYGTPHDGLTSHSGRFPYGSGEDPFQRTKDDDIYAQYKLLKKEGLSDNDIASRLGLSVNEFRAYRSVGKERELNRLRIEVRSRVKHGESNVYIAEQLGISEGTVRNLRKELDDIKLGKNRETANILKENLEKTGYLDVSSGTELYLNGVSKERMKTAVQMLINEGYVVENIYVKQATNPENSTTVKVLAKPGTTKNDIYQNMDKISIIDQTTFDDGETYIETKPPESLSSKRIQVVYADEGGKAKDGVIELRRGVDDISLGKANYAQVRIKVDDDLYIKGMAMYADDLPPGIDVRVNSNKKSGTPLSDVLKPLKRDPEDPSKIDQENPFGAYIMAGGQVYYDDPNGKYINPETGNRANISVVNKLREEGDWDRYSKNLASQFLSKQPQELIKKQLDISLKEKQMEYKEIMALELPELKKTYLESFAEDCDASAVHLKAAALPRQASKVILPMDFLKDTEVYAPAYNNGEQIALVRYPHQGTFEIPILTVNNNNKRAKEILPKSSLDAIGINSSVAGILSGADFDGDTVITFPINDKVKIRGRYNENTYPSCIKNLKDFDPKESFPGYPGMHVMDNGSTSGPEKAVEMGKISNLITDMTLQGAPPEDIARAVKHSMVVIDSPKHKLDYKASERENGILALKKKYQGSENAGASTLISKAKGIAYVDERKRGAYFNPNTGTFFEGTPTKEEKKYLGLKYVEIDPETGKKLYRETGRTYNKPIKQKHIKKDKNGNDVLDKNGKPVEVMSFLLDEETGKRVYGNKEYIAKTKLTKMGKAENAYELSSGFAIENMYADYANALKKLGNEARKSYLNVESTKVNSAAKEKYANEVASLNGKLRMAQMNAPKERKAQLVAASKVTQLKRKHREINEYDKDSMEKLAKYAQKSLSEARGKYGANKKSVYVNITEKEMEAIKAGAVSSATLYGIINNTDKDKLRELVTPKNNKKLNDSRINLIKQLDDRGYTLSEIADKMGISTSTVSKYIRSS